MSTDFTSNKKFDLITLVTQALQKSSKAKEAGRNFIDDLYFPKFAMGRNEDTLKVHQFKSLNGVIDDYYPQNQWRGIPIIKSHLVPKESMLLNASTSISPLNVQSALSQLSNHKIVGLNEVIQASDGRIKWPHFVDAQRKETSENLASWQNIHDLLADEESKKTLRDILCFRLTADISYMSGYLVRIEEQYFESFMNFNQEIFVDAGGFDGDTTESFAKLYPNYRKVIFFEPSQLNMAKAKHRLAGFQNIEFLSLGLSDSSGTLGFDPKSGSASSIQQHGVEKIIVDTLDHAVSEPVTFIKMDLEGWEINALQGSHRHIRTDRPKLAIAVYHHAPDLRLIYEYINSFDHQYKVYLRHYTQGWSETVMYFL